MLMGTTAAPHPSEDRVGPVKSFETRGGGFEQDPEGRGS